jgi:hypothetical protein
MLRTSVALLSFAALGATAFAQSDLRSKLHPVTSKVKNAGTLHLGTGTWTRAGSGQIELGASYTVVYANTCTSGYYTGLDQGETYTDEGGIPNPTQATVASTSIPGANDFAPGGCSSVNVTGFQIGYCTYLPGPNYSTDVSFYDQVGPAGTGCSVPGLATATFNITGLPGSTSLNSQACWLVSFDLLAAPAANFTLTGSNQASNIFAWSYTQVSASQQVPADGIMLAGGANLGTSPQTCSGTDGTQWDTGIASVAYPSNYAPGAPIPNENGAVEGGTGMFNLDSFRVGGNTTIPLGPGCHWFGGNPRASFHLEVYSDGICDSFQPGAPYCFGDGSTATACPCGNFGAPGAGCNNSVGNGGAILSATGSASLSSDTLKLTQGNELANSLSIFLQGTLNIPNGVVFGDGVRCVGGSLKRLYVRAASSGVVSAPNVGMDPSVSAMSATLGDTITPGSTRFYGVYYRDANALFCPNPPGNTWNIGNSYSVAWNN